MPGNWVRIPNRRDVPACLACGEWSPPVAGEQHRHICMQDEGHDGPHVCVWHEGPTFEAVDYLSPGRIQ